MNPIDAPGLIESVEEAMQFVRENRPDLFCNDVHEVSVVHQYASRLSEHPFLGKYAIDLEYNRLHADPKRLPETGAIFRPDLLVHLPNTRFANLLTIEFYKAGNQQEEKDKLTVLTRRDGLYGYRLGVLIGLTENPAAWQYFVDGEISNKEVAIQHLESFECDSGSIWKIISGFEHVQTLERENVKNAKWEVPAVRSGLVSDIALNNLHAAAEREKLTLEVYAHESLQKMPEYLLKAFVPSYEGLVEYLDSLQNFDTTRDVAGYFCPIRDHLLYCHYSLINPNVKIARKHLAETMRWSEDGFDENEWLKDVIRGSQE